MSRTLISSGSQWEPVIGYSRAVVVGNQVFVAGTTGANADGSFTADMFEQTRRALEVIGGALNQAGASFTHVVRSTVYTTDISQWEAIAKAHGEIFSEIRPAMALVEVSRLINPAMLVEVEVTAVIV